MRKVGGGTIALSVLVCAGVFAAISGPALSLHLRTQALQQTFDQLGGTVKTVQASASLSDFLNDVNGIPAGVNGGPGNDLTPSLLEQSRQQIRQGLARVPLPLGAGDWAGLSTKAQPLAAGYSASAYVQQPPKVALIYRDTLTSNADLVAGSLSPPASAAAQGMIPVSVTAATAARFGIRPGSRLTMGTFTLLVTGILRVRDANNDFWQTDPAMLTPEEETPHNQPAFWLGEFAIDPSGMAALQQLPSVTLLMEWEFPLATGGVNADQVTALGNSLSRVSAALPQLSGEFATAANDISVSTSLLQPVQQFVAVQTAVLAVLLLLFVSLAVTAAAVIVLAGRMIVDRRSEELVLLRSRGASSRQVAALLGKSTALIAIPAAVAGAGLALLLVPGAGRAPGGQGGLGGWLPPENAARLGWTLAGLTLLLALAAAPAIGTWRHRRPAPAANPALVTTADTGHLGGYAAGRRFTARGLRRLIAEVTACGLAIAGLVVLHGQGVPSAGSTNWFLTAAPALAAIPAVIVILRLYPLIIRLVLRLTGRRAGPTGYIALASSAGTSLATTAPAFALVLALTVSAFGGMVTDAINSGQVSSSWQVTGADVLITTGLDGTPVTQDAQRVLARIRGVRHEAGVSDTSWFSPSGRQIEATAVAPAQYAALTATTPFPALPAHTLVAATAPLTGQSVTDVLASPAAAAILGTGVTTLNSLQGGPLRVRIAGTVASTPADPAGGAFILLPLPVLPPGLGQPLLNAALLTGTSIDRAQVDAAVSRLLPGSTVDYRADVLAGLRSAPLQHGAELMIVLTIVAAAGFGLLNLILGLALGAADRDLTSARLAVMGFEQAGRLAVTETLPAVLAATAGGLACALVLPPLVSNALDLSVFTDSSTVIPMRPGLITVGLPAAAMLLLAVVALVIQTRLARHHGATGLLRIG